MAWPIDDTSVEFKVQAPSGAGVHLSREESLHGLAKRHVVRRDLILVWIEKCEDRRLR